MFDVVFLVLRRLRGPLILLVLVYAIAVMGMVLIPGVDAHGNPSHMSFFHAFYFVSFMGSTIGFGEIPYPFTDAQRFWVTGSIYVSVFAWLYAIGRSLALLQDPVFVYALTQTRFERSVRNLGERFYLVCGYGDTGSMVTRGLIQQGVRVVVVDHDQDRINRSELDNHSIDVPSLRADVSNPQNLISGGLQNIFCAGLVAVTNDDLINLKVAITGKTLNKNLKVISRSELHDVGINMASFGTDYILNPFDMFAERLAMAVHSPSRYMVRRWLTAHGEASISEPPTPPRGRWILCGYGRFGKAVGKLLVNEGIETTIIDSDPTEAEAPPDAIHGRGTEAVTLEQGGVKTASGIIAGTDDDANNLSIIITALELNPSLFVVARQNREQNEELFEATDIDIVMQRSDIIASEIVTLITNPLLSEFLDYLNQTDDEHWCDRLADRIRMVCDELVPQVWTLSLTRSSASAAAVELFQHGDVMLGDVVSDPENDVRCLALLLQRGKEAHYLPSDDVPLELGDRLLLCGRKFAQSRVIWNANHQGTLLHRKKERRAASESAHAPGS